MVQLRRAMGASEVSFPLPSSQVREHSCWGRLRPLGSLGWRRAEELCSWDTAEHQHCEEEGWAPLCLEAWQGSSCAFLCAGLGAETLPALFPSAWGRARYCTGSWPRELSFLPAPSVITYELAFYL